MLSISEQQEQRWACAASYISILVETGSKEAASVRMRSLNLAAVICSLPIPSFLQLRVDCMTMYLTYILRFYKKGTKMYLCFWSANNHFMTPDPYPVSLWVAYPAAKEETLVLHSFINNQVFLQVVWFFNYILLVIPLYFYMKLHFISSLPHLYLYAAEQLCIKWSLLYIILGIGADVIEQHVGGASVPQMTICGFPLSVESDRSRSRVVCSFRLTGSSLLETLVMFNMSNEIVSV